MGKNSTKAEKAKRNLEYAKNFKKRTPRRTDRPVRFPQAPTTTSSTGTSHRVICAACGVETTVPFEPIAGKPVYCRSCFRPKTQA